MSSPRLAKIATTVFQLIGGSLADPARPAGPPCSCDRCTQAWWRNQASDEAVARAKTGAGLGRVSAG
jgi:hypothetical protein